MTHGHMTKNALNMKIGAQDLPCLTSLGQDQHQDKYGKMEAHGKLKKTDRPEWIHKDEWHKSKSKRAEWKAEWKSHVQVIQECRA